ncbi:MAG: 4Fe-4S binding protein [Anaerolineae bacterium]|nr:4Fe-4S binding protein [Anaerolineae bacterium]
MTTMPRTQAAWPWRPARRLVQITFAALLVAAPILGLFRIDLPGRYMVILDRPVWLQEFYFLLLLSLMFVFFFTAATLVLGRVWCGWLCPQTILSEAANRAEGFIQKQRGPTRALGIALAALALVGLGLGTGFVTLSYLVNPGDLWAMLSEGRWPTVLWLAGGVTAAAIIADIALLRHKFCQVACPYGMMQAFLTDQNTLRIRFLTERAKDCINCYRCSLVCPMALEPRKQQLQLECINCAECVVACEEELRPAGLAGLVEFSFGQRTPWRKQEQARSRRFPLSGKALVASAVFVAYTVAFVYLVLTRAPVALRVAAEPQRQVEVVGGLVRAAYRVEVTNRTTAPDAYTISVVGLPEGTARAMPAVLAVAAGQEARATVEVALPRAAVGQGLHAFTVRIASLNHGGQEAEEAASLFVPGEY